MVDKNGLSVYQTAQEGLIASLLFLPDNISLVSTLVTPEDFSDGHYGIIYNAMLNVNRKNQPINLATIIADLNDTNRISEAKGVEEVTRLLSYGSETATVTTIEQYARTVKNYASKSRLESICREVLDEAGKNTGNARVLLESTRDRLESELVSLMPDDNKITTDGYADEYVQDIMTRVKTFRDTGKIIAAGGGLPTGFPTIDTIVGGWRPSQVSVVGARTNIGKTFFLIDSALAAAHAGASVLFFSLEMPKDDIMSRLVAANGVINLSSLNNGTLTNEDIKATKESVDELSKLKITMDLTPEVTVDYIRAVSQQVATSDKGLDLIIVDYLQLITPNASWRSGNREREVAEISRNLKLLAAQLKVPVLVAVQLNRLHRGDENPEPTMHDIRESNAIAQDANVVILIDRDTTGEQENNTTPAPSKFIIAKNRGGYTNVRFMCNTNLKYARFEEIEVDKPDDSDNDGDDGVENVEKSTFLDNSMLGSDSMSETINSIKHEAEANSDSLDSNGVKKSFSEYDVEEGTW